MKITYVWDDSHCIESYLDGIISDPTDRHIYNCGPEWEIGNLNYSAEAICLEKLEQVERLILSDPELKNRMTFLRGCHSVVCDSDNRDIRIHRKNQDVNIRVENLFGHHDFMYHYLLWEAMGMFTNQRSRDHRDRSDPHKLFVCLQHRPHPHRISAMLALCELGLDHRGTCTFANSTDAWQAFEHRGLNSPAPVLKSNSHRLLRLAQNLEAHNTEVESQPPNEPSWSVIENYPDYLFDIVVESTLQTNFFTEKTFKPVFWGKPFVILGSPNQNTILRDLGYETFPEYFDLTSDSDLVFDNENAFHPEVTQHYCKILTPLQDISDSDILKIYHDTRPKVRHNHSVMVKHLFDDDMIPDYLQIPNKDQNIRIKMSTEYIDRIRSWLTQDEYFKQFV